jgi:CNT family concentrative nucleoside transporter
MTGLWALQATQSLAELREGLDTPLLVRLSGILGIGVMLALAWVLSTNRRHINWRLVGLGVGLQGVLGVLVLKTAVGRWLFQAANVAFTQLLGFTQDGASFVFGNLVNNNVPVGVPLGQPAQMADLQSGEMWANTGSFLAFSVLPTIIFFAALTSILYYLGVLQRVVGAIAWIMRRVLGTSGAETLSVAGNIFVGPTEAPLLIKPFIGKMTYSELNTVMVGGFATIAGGVMAAYVAMLTPYFSDIAGHLMTASVMNAPAAMLISKILVPEVDRPDTSGTGSVTVDREGVNLIDAASSGATQGLKLALNVGAMLIAFVALIALFNALLGAVGGLIGLPQLSIEWVLGWVFGWIAFAMGVPWAEAGQVGALIGVKIVLTEFIAYLQLAANLGSADPLSPRASLIAIYALLGFANLPSIAIQIGGIGGIAPERRGDLSRLGLRAMIGGNLAAFLTACWAGMLV